MVAMPFRTAAIGEARVISSPLPTDLALVRPVRPGQDLDQRRLARTVLAQQAVHFTRPYLQVNSVQRPDAGEGLDDAAHLQQDGT